MIWLLAHPLTLLPEQSARPKGRVYKELIRLSVSGIVIVVIGGKEVFKEQSPPRNPSAAVRRVLQGTNVANQRPPFWSGRKSTNPAISSQ